MVEKDTPAPIVVLLIPGLKLVPSLYSWRIRSRIYAEYFYVLRDHISFVRDRYANSAGRA